MGKKIIVLIIAIVVIMAMISIYFLIRETEESKILDSDGDGYNDEIDAFPDNINEWNDTDNDGYGDNTDAFLDDPNEWTDKDGDGFGSNTDINDDGNGAYMISIKDYITDTYTDELSNYPDPFFIIRIDTDSDDEFDLKQESDVFWDPSYLSNPYYAVFDVKDDFNESKITIEIWDKDDFTSDEPIDYNGSSEANWSVINFNYKDLPIEIEDDGSKELIPDEIDIILRYRIEITKI